MSARLGPNCPYRDEVERLAADAPDAPTGPARSRVHRHLEHCESCRTLLRRRTGERYPKFRNYTILERLGEGGFGVVYKAIHHEKARTEALKVLFESTRVRTAYFENEVQIVARLRHPHLATLYEAHLGSAPLYYAMEYVEGEQLDEHLRRNRTPLAQRIELIRTVALAIGYAHQNGVVHRDLKPQNILIDPAGQPRVLDFGIAKRLATDPEEALPGAGPGQEGVLGTYGYIAPEQIARAHVDWRADIFALGALLFHAVTGRPARDARHIERIAEVLRERGIRRADDLAAIIARCVDPIPDRRYASCDALADDLAAYLAGRAPLARGRGGPGYRTGRMLGLLVRQFPVHVRGALALTMAALLTALCWKIGARWYEPGDRPDELALVAVTPRTLEAIPELAEAEPLPGLSVENRRSWRLLYARLLERLAGSGVRAVVFDYGFPTCQPDYDPRFVAAIRALGAPVVVGTLQHDKNAEPLICPALAEVVYGVGALASVRPDQFDGEFGLVLALQRGFEPLVPGLAVLGLAATRQPEARPHLESGAGGLELRYRRTTFAPGESRWLAETDAIASFSSIIVEKPSGPLAPGDRVYLSRVHGPHAQRWSSGTRELADCLRAPDDTLRSWFGGRVVLVGQFLPGADEHRLADGTSIHGAAVQAGALQSLLAGARITRLSRGALLARVLGWTALAAVVAGLVRMPPLARPVWTVAALGGVSAAGVALVSWVALRIAPGWVLEAGLATGTVLAVGGLVLMVNFARAREQLIAPAPVWDHEPSTIRQTLVATTASLASSTKSAGPPGGASRPGTRGDG